MDIQEKLENYNQQIPPKVLKQIKQKAENQELSEEEINQVLEKTKQEFDSKQVEYGEPVGTVAAQSIGEPGTQMSIDYEEKVLIKRNDEIETHKIGEFVDSQLKENSREKNDWEVAEIKNQDLKVPSLTKSEKIEWKTLEECSRHPSPNKLLEIETSSGRKIKATKSHSFLVRKNNQIKPVSGSKLEEGNRIPSIEKLKENCITKIKSQNYLDSKKSKQLPAEIRLDKDFGWFLGTYLAQGRNEKEVISISIRDEDIEQKAIETINKLSFSYEKDEKIKINSEPLQTLLKTTSETLAGNKKVPVFAYSAQEKFVSSLLRGIFDLKSEIDTKNNSINIKFGSKELINGISILLTRLGIFSVKRTNKNPKTLSIPSKYSKKFKEKIGHSSERKNKKMGEIEYSPQKQEIDKIPGTKNLIKEICQETKSIKEIPQELKESDEITREKLQEYTKKLKKEIIDQEAKNKIKKLEEATESDVIWDKIEKIEEIDPSHKYVYDFSVKETENFTTYEGIVTHNTMRTFHYAGVTEIDVTLGLPRLIEIVDARKTPSSPMMTIKLKEEYADDKQKAREVAWKIEETKLKDVANVETDFSKMRIEIDLENKILDRKNISEKKIIEKIEGLVEDSITEEKEKYIARPSSSSYREILRLVDKIREIKVAGIEDINRVIIRKEGEEYTIYTEGSAFEEVLGLDEVDASRTHTNDLHEVYDALGIEASRRALINEATDTLNEQGLEVDIRHIMLVSDLMTNDGRLKAIGRHGVSGEKQSPLARAAFEVTVNHLLDAGKRGEIDRLKGVPENVIVGQPIELGTGIVDLKMKEKEE